jgi:tetratricopeptide (TPR) repeat protein
MNVPDWRTVTLDEGILCEVTPDPGRLVLWLPLGSEDGLRLWHRLSPVPGAPVSEVQGLCATPATVVRARQRRSLVARLLARWRGAAAAPTWILPDGTVAEQQGERQTDLLLVWSATEAAILVEERVRSCWPQATALRRLGQQLFLVSGVELPATDTAGLPPPGSPQEQAEWLLSAARRAGDRRREASALNDLGVVCTHQGEALRAVTLLQEALALAHELKDLTLEGDVRGNLGLAFLGTGQPRCALQLLEQALAQARAAEDRYAEKVALDHLGTALSALGDSGRALSAYGQALTLARELDDRRHEVDLLWQLATQHADLGGREDALALGQEAIELLRVLDHPHADWFADHLRRYQAGEAAAIPAAAGPSSGEQIVGGWTAKSRAEQGPASGPGLLRMAFTAAKAMVRFVTSGLKVVPTETRAGRLRVCAGCAQHTGMRCRVCGCFTAVKARLPHESCPLGKWPAEAPRRDRPEVA